VGASEKLAATFHGGNTDPRAEVAARIIQERRRAVGHALSLYPLTLAKEALAAADEADRAAGFVRLRVDDETVERIAQVLANAEVLDYWDGFLEIQRALFRDKARAVLAALRGES
jgi:hypothetical protein